MKDEKTAPALQQLPDTASDPEQPKHELSEYELDMLALDEGTASLSEFLAPYVAAASVPKGK